MIKRAIAILLLFVFPANAATFAGGAATGGTFSVDTTPPPAGDFITIAEADAANGDSTYASIDWPYVYTTAPYDPRSWTEVDVTNSTDLTANGLGSCSAIVANDNANDADELGCMLALAASDQKCLTFPNGTYDFDPQSWVGGNSVFRPSFADSEKCIKGESKLGADFVLGNITQPMEGGNTGTGGGTRAFFAFLDGEDAVNPTTAKGWISGYTKGTTQIVVDGVTGLSASEGASGNWVILESSEFYYFDQGTSRDIDQPGSCCYHPTRITNIADNGDSTWTLTLAHPLPKDFPVATMGGMVTAYNPARRWALLDFSIRFADSIKYHQAGSWQFVIHKNMVETIIENVRMQYAYRQFMTIENQLTNCQDNSDTPPAGGGPQSGGARDGYCDDDGSTLYTDVQNSWVRRGASADVFIKHNDFIDPLWDKGANGYGILIAADRVWFHDNALSHSTPLALQYDGDSQLITFNHLFTMDPACADANDDGFCDSDGTTAAADQLCDGNFGDGGGNDCRIGTAFHSGAHGVIIAPNGYTHCSGDLGNTLGYDGETSCLGAHSGKTYSCIEYHNKASSNVIIARNSCDSGLWFGNNSGFDGVRVHANLFRGTIFSGGAAFNTGGAAPGQLARWRNENGGTAATSILPNNWTHDTVFSANVMDSGTYSGQLGVSGQALDQYGNGMVVIDNVIESSCDVSDATNPDGTACASSSGGDFRAGVNTTWGPGNEVGVDVRVGTRTIPSLPGTSFTDWSQIPFVGSPSFAAEPYVGADSGYDPDTAANVCLPARARLDGC